MIRSVVLVRLLALLPAPAGPELAVYRTFTASAGSGDPGAPALAVWFRSVSACDGGKLDADVMTTGPSSRTPGQRPPTPLGGVVLREAFQRVQTAESDRDFLRAELINRTGIELGDALLAGISLGGCGDFALVLQGLFGGPLPAGS